MKITALYNSRGAILAAAPVDNAYSGPDRGPVPVASRGAKVGVFDVPESLTKRPLDEVCRSLKVDVRSQRLIDAKAAKAGRDSKGPSGKGKRRS
jgi:hypothetical protein